MTSTMALVCSLSATVWIRPHGAQTCRVEMVRRDMKNATWRSNGGSGCSAEDVIKKLNS